MGYPPLRSLVALVLVLVLLSAIVVWVFGLFSAPATPEEPTTPSATTSEQVRASLWPEVSTIGYSVDGRNIDAYTFENGPVHLLFVGGIHGGYEWNSILLAYEAIDYFAADQKRIPSGFTVTIIPSLNPDGAYDVLVSTSLRESGGAG